MRGVRFVVVGLLALIVIGLGGGPASAHGDAGTLALEVRPTATPGEVIVRVRLVYGNDGDPAPGATVTVSGTGPDGVAVAQGVLTDLGDGIYEGSLAALRPGPWTLTATAAGPAATATESVVVGAIPATSTTAPVPSTKTAPPARARAVADVASSDGDGGSVLPWIVGAGVVAATAGVVVVARGARRRPG